MNKLRIALAGLLFSLCVIMLGGKVGAAPGQAPAKVDYYSHQQVAAAFAKGGKLVEGDAGKAVYQVLTARRDGPGEVEVHKLDSDIMYVVEGSATFVTGGTVQDGRNTAPNEIRGKSIASGDPHQLGPGDIIIVPNNTPHWFQDVKPPFTYLVIKVR